MSLVSSVNKGRRPWCLTSRGKPPLRAAGIELISNCSGGEQWSACLPRVSFGVRRASAFFAPAVLEAGPFGGSTFHLANLCFNNAYPVYPPSLWRVCDLSAVFVAERRVAV